MSTIPTVSTSSILSSIASKNTTGSTTTTNTSPTSTSSTTSTPSASPAYTLDVNPALIGAAIKNTYDTQLFNSLDTDPTITNAVTHDFYSKLSSSSLNYVIASNTNTDTTTDASSNSSGLLDISV
jgi:hypothetical protein